MLTVSPSPHVHAELSTPKVMQGVIVAMLPLLIFSVINFGLGAIYVTTLSVIFCVAVEWAVVKFLIKSPSTLFDGSAVVTGMLLAFNVPSNLPWYILLIGSIVAMGIGKWTYGGLGNNLFNPALVGRVFLLLSFPVEMTSWPVPTPSWTLDAVSGATPLAVLKDGLRAGQNIPGLMGDLPGLDDLFFGFTGGSLGETSAIAILLGFLYLLYKKIITWHTPVAMLGSIFVFSAIFWQVDGLHFPNPVFQLLSGGIMLGAVFMATDYVTSPVSHRGMILYGCGIGIITVLIRLFGNYPEGVSFAILIMNAFVPLINRYVKPSRFGKKKKRRSEKV